MSLSLSLPLALAATVLEALIGYPAPLYRAIDHPVTWMGRWLGGLEAVANRPELSFAARRTMGVGVLLIYLTSIALVAWLAIQALLPLGALGFAVLTLLAASLPAQRSLATHVRAVADGLDASLDEGRRAVANIVGRISLCGTLLVLRYPLPDHRLHPSNEPCFEAPVDFFQSAVLKRALQH